MVELATIGLGVKILWMGAILPQVCVMYHHQYTVAEVSVGGFKVGKDWFFRCETNLYIQSKDRISGSVGVGIAYTRAQGRGLFNLQVMGSLIYREHFSNYWVTCSYMWFTQVRDVRNRIWCITGTGEYWER